MVKNSIYPLNSKCDFSQKKINNIKIFLDVNFDFCIKSGMKTYTAYRNKAINEISKDNVFLVRLDKNISYRICNNLSEKDSIIEFNKQNIIDKENYWYFLACYSTSVHLRNYVYKFFTIKV